MTVTLERLVPPLPAVRDRRPRRVVSAGRSTVGGDWLWSYSSNRDSFLQTRWLWVNNVLTHILFSTLLATWAENPERIAKDKRRMGNGWIDDLSFWHPFAIGCHPYAANRLLSVSFCGPWKWKFFKSLFRQNSRRSLYSVTSLLPIP